MNVLLIEDEPRIAAFVTAGLHGKGFQVTHCDNGKDGLALALQPSFDVVVLDLMLPGLDGLDVLRELRAQGKQTPVLLLSALNELCDRVQGLNLGADDYLPKPFYVEELAARLQAIVRRMPGERQSLVQRGQIVLDRIHRVARLDAQTIELTTREFSLLEFLMRSPGQVFARPQILEHVWGFDFDPSTNVVDVCVNRLRSKLAELTQGRDDNAKACIEAVRGVGYRFMSQD